MSAFFVPRGTNSMKAKPLHPAWLRILHWIHFYSFGVMVWSGLAIYWAYQAYYFKAGKTVVYAVPKIVFDWLGIKYSLATGLAYHFSFMWVIMVTGLLYLVLSLISGNWRHLFPMWSDMKNSVSMLAYTFKIRKTMPVHGKYNPIQKLAYFTTVLALILLVLSGIAIYKPARLGFFTQFFGGYKLARAFHFWCTYYLVFFFVVHVVQVVRAGWKTFSAMVTGGSASDIFPAKP